MGKVLCIRRNSLERNICIHAANTAYCRYVCVIKGAIMKKIFDNYAARYERTREEEYSLQEYLDICKRDKLAFASAAERLLAAIGEPELVDTRHDPRRSRIFANKIIKI